MTDKNLRAGIPLRIIMIGLVLWASVVPAAASRATEIATPGDEMTVHETPATETAVTRMPDVAGGTRVRIKLIDKIDGVPFGRREVKGTLQEIGETELVVQEEGLKTPTVIERGNVAEVQRSVRPSRRTMGGLIGVAVGATAGILFLVLTDEDNDNAEAEGSLSLAEAAPLMGMYCGVIGGLIGIFVAPGEKWQTVTADGPDLGLGTGVREQGGLTLALRLGF